MKQFYTRGLLAGLLLLAAGTARAQIFPNLGGQRAGISGLTFLKNDLSPRSVAMGGMSVTLSGDGYSLATNPAAVSELTSLGVGISNLYYANGLNHSFAAVTLPLKNEQGNLIFSVNNLSSGAMERRTEFQPGGTGEFFYAVNLAAGAGYSRKLSDMFSFGVYAKYLLEQLDTYKAHSLGVDLGFLYRTDFKDLRFGAALYNFGNNSTLKGSARPVVYNRSGSPLVESYPLPTLFKFGVSIKAFDTEDHDLVVGAQLNHPNDNAENVRLGVEYLFREFLALRAGYKINVIGEKLPTAGLGARFHIGAHPVRIDYAFAPSDYLGMWHSLGLSFSANRLSKETVSQPTNE